MTAPESPPATKLAMQFAKELAKWTAAGFPRRNRWEREEIAAICSSCQNYVDERGDDRGYCGICFCPVHRYSQKLKWATTHCPDDPPKWTALDNEELEDRRVKGKLTKKEEEQIVKRVAKRKGCGGCGKPKNRKTKD